METKGVTYMVDLKKNILGLQWDGSAGSSTRTTLNIHLDAQWNS